MSRLQKKTVVCEEKLVVSDQVPEDEPVAVEELGDSPFWRLLAQADYTSW